MITAREAKKIAEESDAAFKALLEKAGEKIEETAKNGICTLNLSQALRSWDKFQCAEPRLYSSVKPELTEFQKRLERELKNQGYGFTIKPFMYKDGGGLGGLDADDNPPEEKTRYDILLSW